MNIKDLCLKKDVLQITLCAKDRKNTSCDDFIVELEKYLNWFKNKRIKKRLGYLSPKQFMLNYMQY